MDREISTETPPSPDNPEKLNQAGKKRLVVVSISTTLFIVVMFIAAGRLDWLWGWVYFGLTLALLFGNSFYILKTNPQAINERGRTPTERKNWDKTILTVYNLVLFAFPIIIGLDVRTTYSQVPLWLHLSGGFGFVIGNMIVYWAMANNSFLATYVVVQTQRGHRVTESGPYRLIRHPMYLGIIISWLGQPLLLGSWIGFIPAGLAIFFILLRTIMEDRTLIAELPGYPTYAVHVRYRLLPGVW